MIPKRIFFIWIGPKKPYVDFCVNTFKKVNYDFDINFQQFKSLSDYNDDLKYCLDIFLDCINNSIIDTKDEIYNQMLKIFKISLSLPKLNYKKQEKYTLYNIDCKLYPVISDGYRFYLLYKYGGIYLDCDTFPNMEFDDKFLSLDNVRSFSDIFMLGTKENNKFWFIMDNKDMKSLRCNIPTQSEIKDFYNCRTVYNRDINKKYINHYRFKTWQ